MTVAMQARADERLRRIGEVADELGVTTRTIRYYEQLGLLGDGDRRLKGTHRLYSPSDIDRLRELIRLRDLLGLSLNEVTQLADAAQVQQCLHAQWQHTSSNRTRARIIRSAITNVERQLDLVHTRQRGLADFEVQLTEKLTKLRAYLTDLDSRPDS
jgi:DNA-binding transcriptional MerR regulator